MRQHKTQVRTVKSKWFKTNGPKTVCTLCPHTCSLEENQSGKCSIRKNQSGSIVSLNYGEVTAASIDPIEKKPLYHFHPGEPIFSIGTFGCNFQCPFCQNYTISQLKPHTSHYTPEEIINSVKKQGSDLLAFTYSEPVVWYEFVYDCAVLAHENGIKTVMVSNGFINPKPLEFLSPYIDAWNIDLKTFNKKTYVEIDGGALQPVLDTIKYVSNNSHVEITTLIVTNLNDSMSEMREIAEFIASVNKKIPWHISKYFPNYKYKEKSTSDSFILNVYDMAESLLNHVYCGNMSGNQRIHNTYCQECGNLLIDRIGYHTEILGIVNGNCKKCGEKFEGVM
jgi:pyruvate formate lyase activating enzyme